jgi:hypothetical protein
VNPASAFRVRVFGYSLALTTIEKGQFDSPAARCATHILSTPPRAHAATFILRSRKLFITTDTLENAIAAEAMMGESSQPVKG